MDSQEQIQKAVELLFEPNQLVELRGKDRDGRMYSAYYTDAVKLARVLERSNDNDNFEALWYTLQKPKPGINIGKASGTTTNRQDIQSYKWLVIDIDRAKGPDDKHLNATDEELANLRVGAGRVVAWLRTHRFSDPIVACSGNGWHLLYRIPELQPSDYPMLRDVLRAVKEQFKADANVFGIDTTLAEPEQIIKAYGTVSRKTPKGHPLIALRPWRKSFIETIPKTIQQTDFGALSVVSCLAPVERKAQKASKGDVEPAKLTEFLDKHEVPHHEYADNEWDIVCPWEELHSGSTNRDTSVAIIDGLPTFHCLHGHCDGKTFRDFRDHYDPKHNFRFVAEIDAEDWNWGLGEYEPPDVPEEHVEPEVIRAVLPSLQGLDITLDCTYGKLRELSAATKCPLGYAYPAMLAVGAAVGHEDVDGNVRGTAYVNLVGNVGAGKTVSMRRALDSIFLPNLTVVRITPGSDRGLIKLCGKGKGPILLVQDEFRNTMTKASFSGSSLAPVLCDLWSEDIAGAADKKGVEECECKLSLLGNLACEDTTDFATIYGANTSKGLADRMIIGFTTETFEFQPIKLSKDLFEARKLRIAGHIFQMKTAWVNHDPKRRRLGEIALRIALITSGINGDLEVTVESMAAALRFCEWQEQLRMGFTPGMSENLEGRCTEAVMHVVSQIPEGKQVRWSKIAKKHNWYRKFGAKMCVGVRSALTLGGMLNYDKEKGAVWKAD
jgi:hypothetical protein